jgi:xanthine dioxygenase
MFYHIISIKQLQYSKPHHKNQLYHSLIINTMAIKSRITVHPVTPPKGSNIDFAAELRNADLENISEVDFDVIRRALYEHQVIIFKGQQNLPPKAQYELTRLFDPEVTAYGHGKTLDTKKSILHPDLKTIPHQPQVQVIGNGPVAEFEGLQNITLKHPHHKTFHKHAISEEDDRDNTRFYRWHIDAALYDLNPPRVTSLMAVQVPKTEYQNLRYDDGSNDDLQVPRGSTAFVSSYRMYDILSEQDKEFARTTKVQYAPHPYVWMSKAKSKSDGLGMVSEGLELPYSELPPIDESKVKILPMCWRNPVTGKLALQVHPSAVEKLHLADGTIIDDLAEVRDIVHRLQRPGIAPELVYPVDWEAGDLALFDNHGVLHSVTGSFTPEEVRIFRQCNLAASEEPLSPL